MPEPDKNGVEELPSDEAIEYVLREYKYSMTNLDEVKTRRKAFAIPIALARLIQQYESHRLKSAVDVAAEAYADTLGAFRDSVEWLQDVKTFKAGIEWRDKNKKE